MASKQLIQAREARQLTQAETARKLAIALNQTYSLRQYQKLEQGKFPKYKKEVVEQLDRLLGTNLYSLLYDQNVPHPSFTASDKSIRRPKIELNENTDGLTFIPISAQGGYSKRFLDPVYTESLQKLYIPGFPYRGDRYRVWEVEGNSMEPEFKEGLYLLTEKVEDWKTTREGNAYVFVTIEVPLIKWLKNKGKTEWTLGNDNDLYPDIPVPINEIKELWLVKKKMEWEGVAPKRFKTKV